MHRINRCTLAGTVWAPALRPLRLHRLRAAPGCPRASPPSRPPRAAARIAPTVRRHPRHPPHLSPRVAAAPGPWLAKTAPYASLFRRMREKGPVPGNIRPKCMLFEIKMATSSPHASISGRNRAIQDTWRANLAAKGPFSRRGARNHAWREDVASAARPFRGSGMRSGGTGLAPCGSGMRSGRTGFAPCGAGLACLPHVPPCRLACARRGLRLPAISPAFIAAVLYASRFATRIAPTVRRHSPHRPLRSGRAVDQALPAALVLPTPRQPNPGPEPTGPRPPVEPPAPTRGDICAHPRPATRCISPCRVGPATVPVIPAKWCGDTIAHTRKLRF